MSVFRLTHGHSTLIPVNMYRCSLLIILLKSLYALIDLGLMTLKQQLFRGVTELRIRIRESADIRMNFDIRIQIRNISWGCHADIASNKRIIF